MKCTCCDWNLEYKRGENKEDFGCLNMKCSARTEARYYPHIGVRKDWWFATQYHLPFKHNNSWFCVVGPVNGDYGGRTLLKKIIEVETYGLISWNNGNPTYGTVYECEQEDVWSVPYMALPVNDDFNREFGVLVSKLDRYLNKLILLK